MDKPDALNVTNLMYLAARGLVPLDIACGYALGRYSVEQVQKYFQKQLDKGVSDTL